LNFFVFEIVSNFDIRYSDLLPATNAGFSPLICDDA